MNAPHDKQFLSAMLLSVIILLIPQISGFYRQQYTACKLSSMKLRAQGPWGVQGVPASANAVYSLAASALDEILRSNTSNNLLAIDVLTPGLNPKLEQKAMLQQESLFRLIIDLLPVLVQSDPSSVIVMFPSTGDAAGFAKFVRQVNYDISPSIALDQLNSRPQSASLALIVTPKNRSVIASSRDPSPPLTTCMTRSVGDPVIETIRELVDGNPRLRLVLLNGDLSDRVTTGMKRKNEREAFRSSIRQAFYFRNIVEISRPSLIPSEIGLLMYQPRTAWQLLVANQEDIFGSGSLNRFMSQAVFSRHPSDPTSINPPLFSLVATFETAPRREDLDNALTRASLSRPSAGSSGGPASRSSRVPIASKQEAWDIIHGHVTRRSLASDDRLREAVTLVDDDREKRPDEPPSIADPGRLGMLDASDGTGPVSRFEGRAAALSVYSVYDCRWERRARVGPAPEAPGSLPSLMREEWILPSSGGSWTRESFLGPVRLSSDAGDGSSLRVAAASETALVLAEPGDVYSLFLRL